MAFLCSMGKLQLMPRFWETHGGPEIMKQKVIKKCEYIENEGTFKKNTL